MVQGDLDETHSGVAHGYSTDIQRYSVPLYSQRSCGHNGRDVVSGRSTKASHSIHTIVHSSARNLRKIQSHTSIDRSARVDHSCRGGYRTGFTRGLSSSRSNISRAFSQYLSVSSSISSSIWLLKDDSHASRYPGGGESGSLSVMLACSAGCLSIRRRLR